MYWTSRRSHPECHVSPGDTRQQRAALTLLELLVVIGIVGILMALLVPAVQRVRETAARTQCANNLRQIGLALHNYHGSHKSFPPGISAKNSAEPFPYLSWHARILPFIEQGGLWQQTVAAYSQTKDFQQVPPHFGYATVVGLYGCPSDLRASTVGSVAGMQVAFTSYLGVEGTNQFRHDGILFLNSNIRITDIRDGTSNTLLVGERPPSTDLIFGWWYAGYGQNQDGSGEMVLGVKERCFGSWAPRDCPNGPYALGPGTFSNNCDLLHFWIPHVGGGVNFLFADGSVRFIAYSAAPIMPALATRAGGETVQFP